MPAQQRLFDPGPQQRPERNYDPNEWVKSPDVSWHASFESTPPKPTPRPKKAEIFYDFQSPEHYAAGAFHTGSLMAAAERQETGGMANGSRDREYLHPYALSGQFALPPGRNFSSGRAGAGAGVWGDDPANYEPKAVEALQRGENIAYRNQSEDKGSTSYVTSRPENLSTWSESTLSDPHAPRHLKHLAEHYELTGKRSPIAMQTVAQYGLPGFTQPAKVDVKSARPPNAVGFNAQEDRIAHVMKRKY